MPGKSRVIKIKEIYLFLRRRFLYVVISPFLSGRENSFSPEGIKKILIIRTDRIGDLVLSTPALRALRKNFPQAGITLVLDAGVAELAKGVPWVDRVVAYRGLTRTVRTLKKERFDLAIDLIMDYPLKTALLAFLSGAQYRVGYDIEGRGVFFNIRVEPDRKEKHIIEHILDVLRPIGVDTTERNPGLVVLDEERRYIEWFLNRRDISGKDLLVGIHPGGHYPSQCWLPERFAQLADEIILRYEVKVVVIGGRNEEGLVHRITGLMKEKAMEIVGISLGKLPALISRCDLFICNNSGPLHIATAVGTPTVSTMGPTVPYLWWPQGENHIVVKKDLPCSPCNYGVCKHHQCMELIAVEDMMEAVKIQLERIKSRRAIS